MTQPSRPRTPTEVMPLLEIALKAYSKREKVRCIPVVSHSFSLANVLMGSCITDLI